MDNYVALYGFMRALAFISIVVSWVSLIVAVVNYNNEYLSICKSSLLYVGIAILSFFFFMGFMKFYRRFTLESLMCLVTDPDLQEKQLDVNNMS